MALLAALNRAVSGTDISSSDYNDNMDRIRASVNSISADQIAAEAVTVTKIPDGTITEAKLSTAVQTLLNASSVPTGVIMWLATDTVPEGFLECDGSSLSIEVYDDLWTAIGTNHGWNGTTHFNIPDLRGRFIRGYANGSTADEDKATRTAAATGGSTGDNVGSYQGDLAELSAHTHAIATYGNDGDAHYVGESHGTNFISTNYTASSSNTNETRPKNIAMMAIIKY